MERSPHDIASMTVAGLNLIKQAISIYDSNLQLVVANLQFQKMFGLPDHLVQVGATFEETIRHLGERGDYGPIDDLDAFVSERTTQARAFEPHYIERLRANGTTISVEGSPLRQGGWVAVYTDITEIKRQEALLRDRSANLSEALIARSEELSLTNRELTATVTALEEAKHDLTVSQDRLNFTNSMIPAHIARVSVEGVYTYSNRKLRSVLPDRSNDVVGRHYRDVLGDDVFAEIEPCFQRALNGEAPVHEFERPDIGRHIRIAMTPETNPSGQVIGVFFLSMDVTKEANARAALTHSRRRELAAQLTSGLAHDFSNLLTIILGQQNRLDMIADLPPQVAEISATIKSAALRGGVLLDGLSQIDAQRALDIKPVEMVSFIDSLKQLAHAAVPAHVSLTVSNLIPDPCLMLDPGFAQDALLNLVLNAVEALEGPGDIAVNLLQDGDPFLEMSVADNGPGFSKHALKNALTPFYTSKGGQLGRGLGLSTAFDFAKSSGGTIRLANAEHGGAIVRIRIPYEKATPIAPGLVLLVEDTLEIRRTLRGYLRKMGHAVIEASSAAEALRLSGVAGLSHVLSDLMLADGSTGIELAKELRRRGPEVPVTFITGLPATDPLRIQAATLHPVLQKPFDYAALAAVFQAGGDA